MLGSFVSRNIFNSIFSRTGENIVIVLLILSEFILAFEHLFVIVYMVLPYSVGG